MNERIRELAEQAGYKDLPTVRLAFSEFNKEKFAELILKDIDKIVDDLYHSLPLEQAAVLLTLDEQIKAHFYATDEETLKDPVCPRCGAPDGGTSCGLPDCGLIFGEYNEQQNS
jgi:hypothetical protein